MSSNNRRINLMERFNQVADDHIDSNREEQEFINENAANVLLSIIANSREHYEEKYHDEEWSTYAPMAI